MCEASPKFAALVFAIFFLYFATLLTGAFAQQNKPNAPTAPWDAGTRYSGFPAPSILTITNDRRKEHSISVTKKDAAFLDLAAVPAQQQNAASPANLADQATVSGSGMPSATGTFSWGDTFSPYGRDMRIYGDGSYTVAQDGTVTIVFTPTKDENNVITPEEGAKVTYVVHKNTNGTVSVSQTGVDDKGNVTFNVEQTYSPTGAFQSQTVEESGALKTVFQATSDGWMWITFKPPDRFGNQEYTVDRSWGKTKPNSVEIDGPVFKASGSGTLSSGAPVSNIVAQWTETAPPPGVVTTPPPGETSAETAPPKDHIQLGDMQVNPNHPDFQKGLEEFVPPSGATPGAAAQQQNATAPATGQNDSSPSTGTNASPNLAQAQKDYATAFDNAQKAVGKDEKEYNQAMQSLQDAWDKLEFAYFTNGYPVQDEGAILRFLGLVANAEIFGPSTIIVGQNPAGTPGGSSTSTDAGPIIDRGELRDLPFSTLLEGRPANAVSGQNNAAPAHGSTGPRVQINWDLIRRSNSSGGSLNLHEGLIFAPNRPWLPLLNFSFPVEVNGTTITVTVPNGTQEQINNPPAQDDLTKIADEMNSFGSSAPTRRYDLWRILSRGPIPDSVLNAYTRAATTEVCAPTELGILSGGQLGVGQFTCITLPDGSKINISLTPAVAPSNLSGSTWSALPNSPGTYVFNSPAGQVTANVTPAQPGAAPDLRGAALALIPPIFSRDLAESYLLPFMSIGLSSNETPAPGDVVCDASGANAFDCHTVAPQASPIWTTWTMQFNPTRFKDFEYLEYLPLFCLGLGATPEGQFGFINVIDSSGQPVPTTQNWVGNTGFLRFPISGAGRTTVKIDLSRIVGLESNLGRNPIPITGFNFAISGASASSGLGAYSARLIPVCPATRWSCYSGGWFFYKNGQTTSFPLVLVPSVKQTGQTDEIDLTPTLPPRVVPLPGIAPQGRTTPQPGASSETGSITVDFGQKSKFTLQDLQAIQLHVDHLPGGSGNPATSTGAQQPNVFQGTVNGETVTFVGVPFDLPKTSGISRSFRITNIRANANGIGRGGGQPLQVQITTSPNISVYAPLITFPSGPTLYSADVAPSSPNPGISTGVAGGTGASNASNGGATGPRVIESATGMGPPKGKLDCPDPVCDSLYDKYVEAWENYQVALMDDRHNRTGSHTEVTNTFEAQRYRWIDYTECVEFCKSKSSTTPGNPEPAPPAPSGPIGCTPSAPVAAGGAIFIYCTGIPPSLELHLDPHFTVTAPGQLKIQPFVSGIPVIPGTRVDDHTIQFDFSALHPPSRPNSYFRLDGVETQPDAGEGNPPAVQITPTGPGVVFNPSVFTLLINNPLQPPQPGGLGPVTSPVAPAPENPAGSNPRVSNPSATPTVATPGTLNFNFSSPGGLDPSGTPATPSGAPGVLDPGPQPQGLEFQALTVFIPPGQDDPSHHPPTDPDALRRTANPYLELASYHAGGAFDSLRPGTLLRLVPRTPSSAQAKAHAAAPVSFSFVSNGSPSGEAFEFRLVDPSGKLQEISIPDGLVVEPLKPGTAQPVSAAPGEKLRTSKLNAYCVAYNKDAPTRDAVYRVAPPEVQERYKPIRAVIRAGRELAAAGKFHPDGDAADYIISIRQYALWTRLENWNEEKFGEVFREKTKQIAEQSKVEWTKQLDDALRALVPGRWRDISMVLEGARRIEATDASRPR